MNAWAWWLVALMVAIVAVGMTLYVRWRPRGRSSSLRVRHDPTPHPVDLWLDDPDEHDGHLVAVIGEGQRPDPGPPPAHVFPRSSDGTGGGPMPPPGFTHTIRLDDDDDGWGKATRKVWGKIGARIAAEQREIAMRSFGLADAGPVEIVLPPESCDADGWPKHTILRAPDGTTRLLRHVGGGVYEETPCES